MPARSPRRTASPLIAALLGFAVIGAGCEGPTSLAQYGNLQVAFGNAEGHPIEPQAGVVSTLPGRVAVGGRIPAGNSCQELRGEAQLVANVLDLRITARQLDTPCRGAVAVYPYLAAREGLVAGSYRVRVEHAYENTGWPNQIVLDTTVVVP